MGWGSTAKKHEHMMPRKDAVGIMSKAFGIRHDVQNQPSRLPTVEEVQKYVDSAKTMDDLSDALRLQTCVDVWRYEWGAIANAKELGPILLGIMSARELGYAVTECRLPIRRMGFAIYGAAKRRALPADLAHWREFKIRFGEKETMAFFAPVAETIVPAVRERLLYAGSIELKVGGKYEPFLGPDHESAAREKERRDGERRERERCEDERRERERAEAERREKVLREIREHHDDWSQCKYCGEDVGLLWRCVACGERAD